MSIKWNIIQCQILLYEMQCSLQYLQVVMPPFLWVLIIYSFLYLFLSHILYPDCHFPCLLPSQNPHNIPSSPYPLLPFPFRRGQASQKYQLNMASQVIIKLGACPYINSEWGNPVGRKGSQRLAKESETHALAQGMVQKHQAWYTCVSSCLCSLGKSFALPICHLSVDHVCHKNMISKALFYGRTVYSSSDLSKGCLTLAPILVLGGKKSTTLLVR